MRIDLDDISLNEDWLKFIERASKSSLTEGGPGSGWFAPPKGTHSPGSQGGDGTPRLKQEHTTENLLAIEGALIDTWSYYDSQSRLKFRPSRLRADLTPHEDGTHCSKTIRVNGNVIDENGEYAGYFNREFDLEQSTVHHHHLELEPGYRNQGVGTRYYQACEETYIELGIERIQLNADMSVGGYAWARMGFDFRYQADRESQAMKIAELAATIESGFPRFTPGNREAYIDKIYAEFKNAHAWEMADFTVVSHSGQTRHVGKEALLNSQWGAEKILTPGPHRDIGDAYYEKKGVKVHEGFFEGGPGSGWFAPPKGTHGPGSQSSRHPSTPVLTKYLSALADIEGRSSSPTARTYDGFTSIILEQGTSFPVGPIPLKYAPTPARECYVSAFRLAQSNSDLTYVEGYAVPDFIDLPIAHAWVVDPRGQVIDTTWENSGVEYLGVPMTTKYITEVALRTGVYGVFTHLNHELLDDGFPDGAVAKYLAELFTEGGPGSGHWGHAGNPPNVGGSVPSGGVVGIGPGASRDTAAMSTTTGPTAKARQAAAAAKDKVPLVKRERTPENLKAIEAALLKGWEYKDEETGFQVKVGATQKSLLTEEGNSFRVTGKIYDEAGKEIGEVTRKYYLETNTAHHELFALAPGYQEKGFGARYYQACEEAYIEMGVEKVKLTANLSVGGYAWAKMGFDFDSKVTYSSYERKAVAESIADAARPYLGIERSDKEYRDIYAGLVNLHAWEMAEFTIKTTGGKTIRIGKKGMLGSDWHAEKILTPGPYRDIGDAYYASKGIKVHESLAEGGPGSGWYAPPKGTHSPGSQGGEGGVGPILNKLPYKAPGYYTGEAFVYATKSVVKAAAKHGMSDQDYEETLTGLLAEHLTEAPLITLKDAQGAMGILEDGRFKTLYETGRSHGSYAPNYRIEAEERGLGTPSDLPIEKRPVYGYIYHDGHTAGSYGEVAFILKDSVKERTTVTVGDSLGDFHAGHTVGRHINNPDSACWGHMAGSGIDIKYPGGKSNPPVLKLKGGFGYLEAQVHGGVTLRDVKGIVLQPKAQRWLKDEGVFTEFLQRAERANIPVFFEQDYKLDIFAGGGHDQ